MLPAIHDPSWRIMLDRHDLTSTGSCTVRFNFFHLIGMLLPYGGRGGSMCWPPRFTFYYLQNQDDD
jgi:hypothetical protein